MIPTLREDFVGFKTSVEKGIAAVVEPARELELEMESELLKSHDQTGMDEELLLMDEQTESSFLKWNLVPVKMP